MNLPRQYAELYTDAEQRDRCQFVFYLNRVTPSGLDRPYIVQLSKKPLLTSGVILALPPGCPYFLDGKEHVRDHSPVIPYSERAAVPPDLSVGV